MQRRITPGLARLGVVIATGALAATLVSCQAADHVDDLPDRLYGAVEGAQPGDVVDISTVLAGEWERIVLMEASHTEDDMTAALGFAWPEYRFGMTGEGSLVLLIADTRVERWAYLPEVSSASSGRLVGVDFVSDYWADLDPDQPVVEVLRRQDDGPIEVCANSCGVGLGG